MNEPKKRMKRLCLTLDAFTIEEAKRRGDGNVSLGIRRAFSPPQVRGLVREPLPGASRPDSEPLPI